MAAEKTHKLSERKTRHINRKRLMGLVLAVVIIAAAAFLLVRMISHRSFEKAELVEEIEQSGGSNVDYLHFGSGILRYSRNGAAFLKADGKELWNISYSYENPRAKLQEGYAMIADIGGTSACIVGRGHPYEPVDAHYLCRKPPYRALPAPVAPHRERFHVHAHKRRNLPEKPLFGGKALQKRERRRCAGFIVPE